MMIQAFVFDKTYRCLLIILFAFVCIFSTPEIQATQYGYKLHDFAYYTSKVEDITLDTTPALNDLKKECYKWIPTILKGSSYIHFSILKSTQTKCNAIQILKLQFGVLIGKTRFAEDRFPFGKYDYNNEHLAFGDDDTALKTLSCTPTEWDDKITFHTAIVGPIPSNPYLPVQFTPVAAQDHFYTWEHLEIYGAVAPMSIFVFEFLGSDLPSIDATKEWQAVTCVNFKYSLREDRLKELDYGVDPSLANLDVVIEMRVKYDGKESWTTLSNPNFLEYHADQASFCDKIKKTTYPTTAPEDYLEDERVPYITDQCQCSKRRFTTPSSFAYTPMIPTPLLPIREAKHHYDSALSDCFELKIFDFTPPNDIWVRLWLNYNAIKCKKYFRTDSSGNVDLKLLPTKYRFGTIVALDSMGLPFGKWDGLRFPKSVCKGVADKNCVDVNSARVVYTDPGPSAKLLVCSQPPDYNDQDPTTVRSEEHGSWPIVYNYAIDCGTRCQGGLSWVYAFQPNYLKSELVKKFQLIAEVQITKLTGLKKLLPSTIPPYAFFYPEVLVIRSPVYNMEINSSFQITSKPTEDSASEDIYINGIYSNFENSDKCRRSAPPPPPPPPTPPPPPPPPTPPPPPPPPTPPPPPPPPTPPPPTPTPATIPPQVIVTIERSEEPIDFTTNSPIINFDPYRGCDEVKGCISPPKSDEESEASECYLMTNKNCEMLVTYGDDEKSGELVEIDKEVIIEMYHPIVEKWLAIGLADTDSMGPAYVVECVIEGDKVEIYHSFNYGDRKDNVRMRGVYGHDTVVKLLLSHRNGSSLYCRFSIRKNFGLTDPNVPFQPKNYDLLRTAYYLVYAWGKYVTNDGEVGNLRTHTQSRVSTKRIALGTRFSPDPEQRRLLRFHACFMAVAIIFFTSLGMFSGRYFKETCVKIKICTIPLWLFVHVLLMVGALCFLLAALAVEIIAHKGWTALKPSPFHSYVGCISFGIVIVVFVMGFFMKTSKFGKYNVISVAHAVGANIFLLMSIVLLLSADRVSFSGIPCQVIWVVGTWGVIYIIFQCVLAYHYCWVDWVVGLNKRRGFAILPIGVVFAKDGQLPSSTRIEGERNRDPESHGIEINLHPEPGDDPIEAPGSMIRMMGFIGITALASLYTAFCVFIIVRNADGAKDCHTTRQIFEFKKPK